MRLIPAASEPPHTRLLRECADAASVAGLVHHSAGRTTSDTRLDEIVGSAAFGSNGRSRAESRSELRRCAMRPPIGGAVSTLALATWRMMSISEVVTRERPWVVLMHTTCTVCIALFIALR